MPQVGAKEFPYTPQGIAEAKAESRKTGGKIIARKSRSYREVNRQAKGRLEKAKHPASKPDKQDGATSPFADAIKRPGKLTADVGGKPSQNMAKVEQLAKSGSPLQKKEANFFVNVLKK